MMADKRSMDTMRKNILKNDLEINGEENLEEVKKFSIEDCEESALPVVSVIIPVYNAEKYLKSALRSIMEQSYKKLEIICVNDGSTDNSALMLQEIAKYDERIKIINQENAGPAAARNAALDAASGKYVSFVDSDDLIDSDMYYYLVEFAENNETDITVFGGDPFPDLENAPQWIKDKMSPRSIVYDQDRAGACALFKENSSVPFLWLHFIRREILEKPSKLRMNEHMDLGEDQLFQFMYFPRAEKVAFLDKKFYFYRWINQGSIMSKYNDQKVTKFRKHLEIVENVFAGWEDAGYQDPFCDRFSWAINFLYNDLISFPQYWQHKLAVEIMKIAKRYDQHIYMCNDWVIEQGKHIEKLAEEEISEDTIYRDIALLQEDIQNLEEGIQKRLDSKAFKLGQILTPKKERLNVDSVLPPIEKKN